MARKQSTGAGTSKSMVKWDEQLAKDAEIAATAEAAASGGQFFSMQGGILKWQDAPLPDNQMAVIILDGIFENQFYEGDYDPNIPQSPSCYAFAREEKKLEPHKLVIEAKTQQHDECASCPMNEWGSADKGRGKACRNTRRLGLLPAGTFKNNRFEAFDDLEHFKSTPVGFMKLPVTSVKGYANFVKQVAGSLKRPPYGIVTKVKVVPDAKSQFKVLFEPIENVSDNIIEVVVQRREEVMAMIDFPYTPFEEEAKPQRGRGKAQRQPAGKTASTRRPNRKY